MLLIISSTSIAKAEALKHCPLSQSGITIQTNKLSLLTLNISHGRKTAWNQMLVSTKKTYRNLDIINSLLQKSDADIIALQEADGPSRWSGKFNHVDYLRNNNQYQCSIQGEHANTWLFNFGTSLLSKASMSNGKSVSFPPSPPTTSKGFVMSSIIWQVQNQQVPVTVVSVHLDFSRKSVRRQQAEILIEALKDINPPLIVMGDFNSRWDQKSSQVKNISETLQLTPFEPESETLGSYKKTKGKRLDWILISSDLTFSHYEVLPDIVSDHLAVYAEVTFTGELTQ